MVGTIGTFTAHGKPLSPGPGSPNILIRGRSVWRVSLDFHSCPVAEGPKLHGGGVVLMGRNRILANNFPIAFKGDQIFEATSVNVNI